MRSIAILSFIVVTNIMGQNNVAELIVHEDAIYDSRIRTVQLFREDWNLSYPVKEFNSSEKLILHFDLLADAPESYWYTFIHCDKDWNESRAFVTEYIDGFEENPIEDYKASFNTTVQYFHYSVAFPNERVSLKLSGNYIIIIYLPGQRDNPVLKQRFMLTENLVKIDISTHRPRMTADNNSHQQVDFTVNHTSLRVNDPYREIFATVLQNGRWDIAKTLKPEFYGNNELKYNALSDKNIFPGGNEFRYFDIRSTRYSSEFVRNIEYSRPFYNFYLQPAGDRESKPYFYTKDFNGKYYVAIQEGRNHETDADYVYVYFTLPSENPVVGGDIYVVGALSNWKAGKDNKMIWNNTARQYECTMLLKQGWYNYEFAQLEYASGTLRRGPFEGNHYETENDYLVLIYYRNPLERYDRLAGYAIQNTLNKITD